MLRLLVGAVVLSGCGGGIRALDPKDTALPEETRQWIADAEDGVIAAKARVESSKESLSEVERWADVMNGVELDDGTEDALRDLTEARLELARRDVEYAESVLELAKRKYDLANAERAVLHDLASYELEPIRQAADEAREKAGEVRARYNEQRDTLQEVTTAWWSAYASYLQSGGDTTSYWVAGAEAFEVEPVPDPLPAEDDAGSEEQEAAAGDADGDGDPDAAGDDPSADEGEPDEVG